MGAVAWILVAFFILEALVEGHAIGKPREPKQAWEVVVNLLCLAGLVLLAMHAT